MIPGPNNSNLSPGESNNEDINNKVQDVINSNEFHTIQIDEGIPFRTLTYPSPPSKNPRTSPMFYHCGKNQLPIRGQEQVLRDSGYPEVNKMPNNSGVLNHLCNFIYFIFTNFHFIYFNFIYRVFKKYNSSMGLVIFNHKLSYKKINSILIIV